MDSARLDLAFVALHTALDHALSDNPALPILWILLVPTIGITIGWLTRYFYRDFDLYGAEDSYHSDIDEIPQCYQVGTGRAVAGLDHTDARRDAGRPESMDKRSLPTPKAPSLR